jgi:hypothetical protein
VLRLGFTIRDLGFVRDLGFEIQFEMIHGSFAVFEVIEVFGVRYSSVYVRSSRSLRAWWCRVVGYSRIGVLDLPGIWFEIR